MSTRAQIIVRDDYSEVWFYRHSDGYPEGVGASIDLFMTLAERGMIRRDAEQAAGWLVIIGYREYAKNPDVIEMPTGGPFGWKVGAYEPCEPVKHGDIDYIYTLDLQNMEVYCEDVYKKTKILYAKYRK